MVAATSFPANHGSPASIREMSQELSRRGHRVHVVTYHWRQDIPVEGVTIHRTRAIGSPDEIRVGPTKQRPLYDFLLTIELMKVIQREKLDIIHAHNYEGALAGWIARFRTGKPLLFNSVTNMVDELPTYNFIRPAALARGIGRGLDLIVPRLADHVTTVTDDLRDAYIEDGLDREKISVVPPGVVPEWFDGADGERIRREFGLGGTPLVMYTGVLNRFQGLEHLLEGFRTVLREIPEARLLLMGNLVTEEQKERLRGQAEELGIGDATILVADRPLDDLPHFLAAADVTVVPRASAPGFPVKLLNYMAARKPAVAAAGSAKNLTHDENGLVVPNGDGEAMGQAVLRLLRDPVTARRLAEAGRRTITDRYEWPVIASNIEQIYARLLDLPSAGAGSAQAGQKAAG
jgi:glycosyltransferase involved in cell wall biosynthesis